MTIIMKHIVFPMMMNFSLAIAIQNSDAFSEAEICDVQARMNNKCMRQVAAQQSLIQCCIHCSMDASCVGASLEKSDPYSCFLHSSCSAVQNKCSVKSSDFQHFVKEPKKKPLSCVNGTWDSASGKCVCHIQFVGELCDRRAHNCTDFQTYHPGKYGYYEIRLQPIPLSPSIAAECFISGGTVRTVLLRNAGEMSFNRSWSEYVNGFYRNVNDQLESRWIGLTMIHHFLDSATTRKLAFKIKFKDKVIEHKYSYAFVTDETGKFALRVTLDNAGISSSSSSKGDCLSPSDMSSFSTWDHINDPDVTDTCAQEAGAGWWFPACNFTCNPMGKFYNVIPPPPTDKGYVLLPDISAQYINSSLIFVEMHLIEV